MSQKPISKYILICKIANGLHGDIYKAIYQNQIVAIKKISYSQQGISISALREITLLHSIQHENVVRLLDVEYISGHIRIVMEYFTQDLQQYSLTNSLCSYQLKSFMKQILQGVNACHQVRCIHRDIKPKNILIDQNTGILKIGDFGMARHLAKHSSEFTENVSTIQYRAPELLLGMGQYTIAVDVWAIGCVFAELILKEPLFQGENEIHQIKLIFSKVTNIQQIENFDAYTDDFQNMLKDRIKNQIDENGFNLLLNLLKLEPEQRISCKNALEHPYFK